MFGKALCDSFTNDDDANVGIRMEHPNVRSITLTKRHSN
jgi:hypothetical protein